VLVDSRGHGRSTRDEHPFSYELMAADVQAVMDETRIETAAVVGWSDGACTALVLAMQVPARISGVLFFGCNMDPSGTRELSGANPLIERCFARHAKDYARLSETPDRFEDFVASVTRMMETQPNYTAADLAKIGVPVSIVQSEHDEFIKPEHAVYLADSIPGAELVHLADVSHFAPLQRPASFNRAMLAFLGRIGG
jgi:pimeloyl-ACP methyl ester carboxylesterase